MRNQKVLNIILGILLGIILFLASLFLILNTEAKDLDNAARDDAPVGLFFCLMVGSITRWMDHQILHW